MAGPLQAEMQRMLRDESSTRPRSRPSVTTIYADRGSSGIDPVREKLREMASQTELLERIDVLASKKGDDPLAFLRAASNDSTNPARQVLARLLPTLETMVRREKELGRQLTAQQVMAHVLGLSDPKLKGKKILTQAEVAARVEAGLAKKEEKRAAAAEKRKPRSLAVMEANAWFARRVDEAKIARGAELDGVNPMTGEPALVDVQLERRLNRAGTLMRDSIRQLQEAITFRFRKTVLPIAVKMIRDGATKAAWDAYLSDYAQHGMDYDLPALLRSTTKSLATKLLAGDDLFPKTKALIYHLQYPERGGVETGILYSSVTKPVIDKGRALLRALEGELLATERRVRRDLEELIHDALEREFEAAFMAAVGRRGDLLYTEAKREVSRLRTPQSRYASETARVDAAANEARRATFLRVFGSQADPDRERREQEAADEAEALAENEEQEFAEEVGQTDARLRKAARAARKPLPPSEPEPVETVPPAIPGAEATELETAILAPERLPRVTAEEARENVRKYRLQRDDAFEDERVRQSLRADASPAFMRPVDLNARVAASDAERAERQAERDREFAPKAKLTQFRFLSQQLDEQYAEQRRSLEKLSKKKLPPSEGELELRARVQELADELGVPMPENLLGLPGGARSSFLSLWRR
jgi:hypothetical protein